MPWTAAWPFPAWFTVLDRAHIEHAVVQTHDLRDVPPGPGHISLRHYSEAAALEAIVTIGAAIHDVLDRHRHDQSRTARRLAAQHLIDQAIAYVKPGRTGAAFAPAAYAALETQTWWPRQRRARPDPAVLKGARERVVLPLLDRLHWLPTQWATKAGVDPSVTLGYLAGTSTPRRLYRKSLTNVLRLALKLPDTFTLPE